LRRLRRFRQKSISICVIGSGYVDLVAAVRFAEISHKVIFVDKDEAKVRPLNHGGSPIYGRHLSELLANHLNRGVEIITELRPAV
jgi:UDPglucose 6-dehydrogenase